MSGRWGNNRQSGGGWQDNQRGRQHNNGGRWAGGQRGGNYHSGSGYRDPKRHRDDREDHYRPPGGRGPGSESWKTTEGTPFSAGARRQNDHFSGPNGGRHGRGYHPGGAQRQQNNDNQNRGWGGRTGQEANRSSSTVRIKTEDTDDAQPAQQQAEGKRSKRPPNRNAQTANSFAAGGLFAIDRDPKDVQMDDADAEPDQVNTNKKFADMTWKEKIVSQQYPKTHFADDLPAECLVEDDEERKKKKEDAAKVAIKKTWDRIQKDHRDSQNSSDDSMDPDDDPFYDPDSVYGRGKASTLPFSRSEIESFFNALPNCLAFTLGFDVLGLNPQDEENCYCPCGRHMQEWRLQFHLGGIAGDGTKVYCTKSKKMGPMGLMGHLRSKSETCPIHFGIETYITELYSKHKGGYGHKALYQLNDWRYKKAIKFEKQENRTMITKLKEELEEERRIARDLQEQNDKYKKELDKLKELSPDQFKKVEQRDEIKLLLKVPAKEKSTIGDDPNLWFFYRSIYANLFDCAKNIVKSLKPPPKGEMKKRKDTIEIRVRQGFCLQELFDSFHTESTKDVTYLFRSLDNNAQKNQRNFHAWKLLADWVVTYEDISNVSERKLKAENNLAIDEGGPTREFFSQVFKQMGDLAVMVGVRVKHGDDKVGLGVGDRVKFSMGAGVIIGTIAKYTGEEGDDENPPKTYHVKCDDDGELIKHITRANIQLREKAIKLFERTDEGFIPLTDEILEDNIKRYTKHNSESEDKKNHRKDDIMERVKSYYRAIGRIMLHCLATDHTISSAAMPRLFQNVLFRRCLPGENEYHRSDVIDHLISIGHKINLVGILDEMTVDDLLCDGDETLITSETYFTKLIPKQVVHSRTIALDNLREGLTLNGLINVPVHFSSLPFDVVSKMAFSNPSISADDVISILEPKYSAGKGDGQQMKEEQKHFFENILKKVLEDKEKEEKERKKEKDTEPNGGKSFLSQFVSFCTGLNYLPHRIGNPDYRIIVEFNFEDFENEASAHESLPVAHTCVNTIKLHGAVYNNDREVFERKLDLAIEGTEGCFGMA